MQTSAPPATAAPAPLPPARGRPALAAGQHKKRVNVMLSAEQLGHALTLGGGSLSRGVQRAIDLIAAARQDPEIRETT